MKLEWQNDLKVESDLARMGVTYEVVTITVDEIDFLESQVNGARLRDALVESLIEDYMMAMKNGDIFPRPVVYRRSTGYVILSGNQRCESVRRLIEDESIQPDSTIEVYCVDTDDKLILEVLARSGNVGHGGRSEKEERLMHAVYAVRSLGMATEDAAKMFVVAAGTICTHLRVANLRDELVREGVDAYGITTTALDVLARLDFDKPTQLQLARLVERHTVTADRLANVVAGIRKEKTAAGRIKRVKALQKELTVEAQSASTATAEAPRAIRRPRRDKVMNAMQRLAEYLDTGNAGDGFTNLDELQIATENDKSHLATLWRRIKIRLDVITGGS